MQLADLGNQPAVGFLGEGVKQVVSAQAGFHVPHGDLLVERRQSGSEGGGGVALDEHQIRPVLSEVLLQPHQGGAGHVGERLAGRHQGQVAISGEAEELHHLRHHFPMLAGEHHPGAKPSACWKARITGASLIASGLVPSTMLTSGAVVIKEPMRGCRS